ncbi:unnamed protein product [Parnassius apollo]|uniref:(apollo) hypothetical protein n=1 Tax=Parnassius apollo TaxID=110799 RepID=A0A8S3WDK6_PARAO|nr:unnamed protein product [Parnassius apollo]
MAKKKSTKNKSKSSKPITNASSTVAKAINTDMIAAALSTVNQPIFMKVCRLCEAKDGPFLNIFDSEKITAKKIEELMPFWIAENDDLPHKICFRCSAKVEELYEFVNKCVKTQESLRKALGKKEPLPVKTKTRAIWEEKLNKSNMSNDDICDALIKKAMEGIVEIPKPLLTKESDKTRSSTRGSKNTDIKTEVGKQCKSDCSENEDDVTLDEIKMIKNDGNGKTKSRLSHSETTQNELQHNVVQAPHTRRNASKQKLIAEKTVQKDTNTDDNKSDNNANKKDDSKSKSSENAKPFDIMDHVSMIKVNGVGVLFQCKLCNRNFLKKEVVISHGCAKTGVPKVDICKMYIPPAPPKVTTIKYINSRIGGDIINTIADENKSLQENETIKTTAITPSVKRKIGPASKIGRRVDDSNTASETLQPSKEWLEIAVPSDKAQQSSNIQMPSVNFPTVPSLNSRYKLIRGPNNTFTLVEDTSSEMESAPSEKRRKSESPEIIDLDASPVNATKNTNQNSKKTNTGKSASRIAHNASKQTPQTESSSRNQPYPVGLFQTVPHHSASFNQTSDADQVPFTTPAMKKQSYTIVQTGNPSKLLISTKPQQAVDEVPKKKQRKQKHTPDDSSKEPFSVVLEDTAPPKDPGFFTFINVDPLLQPSYVLPTDNIIQESQITTSTPVANKEPESSKDKDKDKYTCNLCGSRFNREKKLNAHIYSHYNVEEDHSQEEKPSRKRTRK